MSLRALLGAAFAVALFATLSQGESRAAPSYGVLGQPNLNGKTLSSRCTNGAARFSYLNNGGFEMFGPSGIAIDPSGRFFVTDFGGRRVLTWPNFASLAACSAADGVISGLAGPEAVAIDHRTGWVFVADTLDHTVKGYRFASGAWRLLVTLGVSGVPGADDTHFNFPRGLAFDPGGRLFVADDFNNRVLIFNPPYASGEAAADSIGAGANGGFSGPKAVAMVGHTLFVADYNKSRVLRFTGPFLTPDQVYVANGVFSGVGRPVDLAVHPDGSLLVTDQQYQRIARYDDAAFRNAGSPNSVFAENIGPEPLGVAADRYGRIFIADYRRYRVLIRNEFLRLTPVTAGIIPAAQNLLASFHGRPARVTDRVAIGQQLLSWEYGTRTDPNAWNGDWLQLRAGNYPLPEIMAAETSDLMTYPGFAPNQDAYLELIGHGRAGRIVSLVWHPTNPVPGGNFSTPISTANLLSMTNDATTVGQNWQVQLNRAAAVLQPFENVGVTVLFRPIHEQNGNFFWWGHDNSTGAALRIRQAAWASVWRDMVTELTVRKGLKNILFVFGTNQVNYDGVAPPLTYYPGGNFVDLVSIDIYNELLNMAGVEAGLQHYSALVGTGKPFGIAEFGQSFDDVVGTGPNASAWDARTLTARIRYSYPRTVFAIAWYSSVEGGIPYVFALPDVANTREMLNDPLIDTQ